MSETFGKRYLAELEQLLQAEAQLRGQGTELLDDPEYRALRERFIEGELTLAQLSERVDNLAMTRGDEDVDLTPAGGAEGGDPDGVDGFDEDDGFDDPEDSDGDGESDDAGDAADGAAGEGNGAQGADGTGGEGAGGDGDGGD